MQALLKLPKRTWQSLVRRFDPVYRVQRRADRHARGVLDIDLRNRLEAIPGTSSARQCRLLFYLADTAPAEPTDGCIVEIGSYLGKSTAWLHQAATRRERQLISIDPHTNDKIHVGFGQTVEQFNLEKNATLHRAFSHDIGKNWHEPIVFLWVDGGHDYESVRHDIDDFTPHVQPGAWVVFDDVSESRFPGVVRALAETLRQNPDFQHVGNIKQFELYRRR